MLKKKINKGFSLIELLVATSVFLIIVVLSGQLIRLASFDSQVNTNLNEVQQNARVALKFLERDITNSGDTYLIGLAGGQGLVGPTTSAEAFRSIRGTNNKNMGLNLPTPGNQRQPLFSLLPVRRSDSLGNGAAGGGQTAADNGSADRLTVAYEDEFFVAGTIAGLDAMGNPTVYTTPAARNAVTAPPPGIPPVSNDEEFQGFWTRPTPGNPARLTLAPRPVDTVDTATGNVNYTKIFYDVSGVRAGDIFKLSVGTTEVLAMVSNINPGNPANPTATPPFIEFATDVAQMSMNKTTTNIPTVAAIQAMTQAQQNALFATLYPLDFLPVSPNVPDPAPNTVRINATRVLIYTYFVDPTSRDLIRRRYAYVPLGGSIGSAFVDHPVCQNVERFWVSYNLFVPANPPATTVPSLGNQTDLDPDADQNEYNSLQNIRRVNINLILRSTEIDRRTRKPSRFGIQASYVPRNIVYQINENAS